MRFQKGNVFGKAKNKNKGTVYYKFSRTDIANLTGVKPSAITKDVCRKNKGKRKKEVDLYNLKQFVLYCYNRMQKS